MLLVECRTCQRNPAALCSDTFSYPPSELHPFYLSFLPLSLPSLSRFLIPFRRIAPLPSYSPLPFSMPPPKMNPESLLGRTRRREATFGSEGGYQGSSRRKCQLQQRECCFLARTMGWREDGDGTTFFPSTPTFILSLE